MLLDVTWDEEQWTRLEEASISARRLNAFAGWTLSALALAGAVATALLPITFDDTQTSVVDGLHRYMEVPAAGALRWALAATVMLLLVAASFGVLAAVVPGGRTGPMLYRRIAAGVTSFLGLLALLWVLSAPRFAPLRRPAPTLPTVLPSGGGPTPTHPPPTTVPRP